MVSKTTGKNIAKTNPVDSNRVRSAIILIRDERVILDSDLAVLFGIETKRLNEQVKRNSQRFGPKYVFKLTREEFKTLRSQNATSKTGRGGRRYLPWVFTEHGVVMAATVLDSECAIEASKFIVDVFIDVKRRMKKTQTQSVLPSQNKITPLERLSGLGAGLSVRLQTALNQVLDTVVDSRRNTTVREEAQTIIGESIRHIKERLKKQGIENEEIGARITKLLAEAEKEKAVAAKTLAETEALEFATIVKKLRLLLEVQQAIEADRLDDFLRVLRDFD